MAAEKECYRDNMERICAAFPDKEMLMLKDVVKFLGLHPRTVRKMFPLSKHPYGITKVALARTIS